MLLQVVHPKLLELRPLLLMLGVEAILIGVVASASVGEIVSPQLMFVVVCCSGDALLSAELRYHIKWQTVAICCTAAGYVGQHFSCSAMLTQGLC